MPEPERTSRRRRRAVGPPGAVRVEDEPLPPARERASMPEDERPQTEDERLSADRPPHHDRGV